MQFINRPNPKRQPTIMVSRTGLWRALLHVITVLGLSAFLFTTVNAARLYAPVVAVTLTDTFVGVHDGDGRADPGETIQYTAVINNTGAIPGTDDATGVTFTDTIDPNTTLVGGSVSASPVGLNDTYPETVIGNVSVDSSLISYSVVANDYLGQNPAATIAQVGASTTIVSNTITGSSANGGTVVMTVSGAGMGQFTYNPPAGFEGVDTFTYILADNANAASAAANRTATVSLTVGTNIWFVNNNAGACSSACDGRLSNPFTTLAAFNAVNNGVGNNPGDYDIIFVYESATTYTGGVVLRARQMLIGQDATATLASISGLTPGSSSAPLPTMSTSAPAAAINNASGTAVSNAADVVPAVIRGLTLSGSVNAIDLTYTSVIPTITTRTIAIRDNTFAGSGAEGIDINKDGNFTLTATVSDNTWSAASTGNAFDVVKANTALPGTVRLNFSDNTNINSGADAVFINGSLNTNGAITLTGFANNSVSGNTVGNGFNINSVTFDSDLATSGFQPVSGGVTAVGASGNPVGGAGLVLAGGANLLGYLDFTDLDVFSANAALDVAGAGTANTTTSTGFLLSMASGAGTLNANGGPAATISNATIDLPFLTITSTNSSGVGVSLTSINDGTNSGGPVASTFSAGSGSSITNATGTDFVINSNNADVTYDGTITDDVGQLISIASNTAGAKVFTGAITDGNDGDGSGISITGNSGGTIRFSGGLVLSTGGNPAFASTGNTGTTLEVCDENPCNPGATGGLVNTIVTTTATALNVANTTIGANNLEFRSISSNGGSSTGIILDTTQTSGGLKVVGDGSNTAFGGNGSGGTITNKTGTDGSNTTGVGIYLNSTSHVVLRRMNLSNFENFAIRGLNVNNFILEYCTVNHSSGKNGTDAATDEGSIYFGIENPGGTNGLTGTATVTSCLIEDGYENNFKIANLSGTLSQFTMTGTTIRDNSAVSPGNNGFEIRAQGTANITADISGSTFTGNRANGVQVSATTDHSGTVDVEVKASSTFTNNNIGVNIANGGSGTMYFDVLNSTFNSSPGLASPININLAAGGGGPMHGYVSNNNITNANSSTGPGIRVTTNGTDVDNSNTLNIEINNNNISQVGNRGIEIIARDGNSRVNARVLNNTVSLTDPLSADAIRMDAGAVSTDTTSICAHINGNNATTIVGVFGVRVRQRFAGTTYYLQGYGGSATDTTAVQSFLSTNNNSATTSADFGGGGFQNSASCASPAGHVSPQIQANVVEPAEEMAVSVSPFNAPGLVAISSQAPVETFANENIPGRLQFGLASVRGGKPLFSVVQPAPAQSGETVGPITIGTLPAGKSVTVVFRVTVDNPLPQNKTRILTQGSVSGSNFTTVTTSESPADSHAQCTAAPSIGNQTCTPVDLVDLSVFKNNTTVGDTVVLGNSFNWQVQVSNAATSRTAIFTNGQTILEDNLPSGATYGTVSFGPSGGLVGTASCSITANVLTCTADPGGLSIPPGEGFAVGFSVTPTAGGSLVNPTGGVCAVDPNAVFAEVSTANNTCSNTVTVTRPNTTITSLTRTDSNPNNTASVGWQIVFANPVSGLTASNFSVVMGGGVTGATIDSIGTAIQASEPDTTWNITVNTGSGDGTLGLNFVNDTNMSHAVSTTLPYVGEVYTIDKTGPTVTGVTYNSNTGCLGTSPYYCNASDTVQINVAFSEVVDVNTSGGTPSLALNSGGAAAYLSGTNSNTLVFEYTVTSGQNASDLDYTSTAALGLNGGTIQDTALNNATLTLASPGASGSLGNNADVVVDTTAPVASSFNRLTPATTPTNADTLTWQAIFSESVTGVSADGSDFTIPVLTGDSISVSAVSANTYDVTASGGDLPSFNSPPLVDLNFVASPTIEDLAGNPLTNTVVGFDQHYQMDNTGPTVSMSSAAPNPTNTSPIPVTVQFSEAVTNFISGDIITGNGTVSNFTAVDGDTYTFDLVPSVDGLVMADIAAGVAQDDGGNGNSAATQFSRTYDSIAPSVSIDQASGQTDPTSTSPINFTVTFSEDVSNFETGDMTLSGTAGATTLNITGGPAVYNVAASGMASDGTVILNLTIGMAVDAAGNWSGTPTVVDNNVLYDTAPPSVTINQAGAQADPSNASTINFTVVFSEAVTDFDDAADVTLSGTAGATTVVITGGPTTYNVAVSGMTSDGTVIADVPASVAQDAGANDNTASTSTDNTVTYDATAPTVTINQAGPQVDPTNGSPINFTVVFSEAVTDFDDAADVTLSGTAGATTVLITGGPTTYNVAVSGMSSGGTVIADVPANVAQDAAGNNNVASTSTDKTVTYDGTAPTVTIDQAGAQADPTGASPINFTVVFSEAVTDFDDAADVTLSGGAGATTVVITGGPTTYNVAVSGMAGDGMVIATVPANAAQDTAGNNNAASTSTDNSVLYDTVPPSVTIVQAVAQPDPTSVNPIEFTVVFSEDVTDFDDLSDVTLSGTASATVTGITGSGTTYTVQVTATSYGTIIASVPASVAADLASQPNTASPLTGDRQVTYIPPTDLSITKTDGVITAVPGGSVTYTITASNAGPNADPAATVTDTFPAILTANWTCVGAGGGTCTAAGSGNINDTVNLPVGGSVTYTVTASISPSATGMLSNTASISTSATVADSNSSNNSATDTDTLSPQADISITKTDGVTTAVPGGSVTYIITASNAGPSDAPSVSVADTFPATLTATWTCVGAGGGTCTAAGSGNISDSANLPVGGSVTYTVTATISSAATGTLSNTATVTPAVTDPNSANNSATDTDTLTPQADLSITKTDGVTTAAPGGSVTYTITASNAGPSDAPGATVADTFAASLTANWSCVGAGGGTCTAGPTAGDINDTVNIPAGGSVTYTVTATIDPSATGTLSNTATVTEPGGVTDPVAGNNSATDTDTLVQQADLSITKTDGSSIALAGNSVIYTITASNAGPSSVIGATVADTFPASLSGVTWTCVGAGGGTCTASGSGNINDTVNLPAGGSVTYTATGTLNIAATGTLSNTATVSSSVTDPVSGNDSATDSDTIIPPVSVTIDQASGQLDPTNATTINFTAVFSTSVTGFGDVASDVTLSGTAGATTAIVTGGPTTYNVAVSGMTSDGTVIVDIPAGVVTGSNGETNLASTSSDKTVTYDSTAPTVSINQASGQADPTNASPVNFTVVFSEAMDTLSFAATDVALSGTAGATTASITEIAPNDGTTFNVAVSGMTTAGTVIAEIVDKSVADLAGNLNDPSTSTDNTVTLDDVPPDTTILTGPASLSNRKSATFTFTSDDLAATFECSLDGSAFATCTSPAAYTGLVIGKHTFLVRAVDSVGNPDPTPATYTWYVRPTRVVFASNPTHDGWILESAAGSGLGGLINNTMLLIGDDASNRQYRSLASFGTASLPDAAQVVSAQFRLRLVDMTLGDLPTNLNGLLAEVRKGFFGTAASLHKTDFQATADAKLKKFLIQREDGVQDPQRGNRFIIFPFTSAATQWINLSGLTQLRVRFEKPSDLDGIADEVSIHGGEVTQDPYWKPALVVYYLLP